MKHLTDTIEYVQHHPDTNQFTIKFMNGEMVIHEDVTTEMAGKLIFASNLDQYLAETFTNRLTTM